MEKSLVKQQSLLKVLLIDVALLGAACLIPSLSHLVYGLHYLNPMLWVLLGSMLLVRDRRNGMLLALLLPTVSCLMTGMPTPAKAVCMAAELLVVASVVGFVGIKKTGLSLFAVAMVAVVAGKLVYYVAKALLISSVSLVGTPVAVQLAVALVATACFAFIKSRKA